MTQPVDKEKKHLDKINEEIEKELIAYLENGVETREEKEDTDEDPKQEKRLKRWFENIILVILILIIITKGIFMIRWAFSFFTI